MSPIRGIGGKFKPPEIEYRLEDGPLDSRCMICTSHKPNSEGYPVVVRDRKQPHMHRYLYQLMYGEIFADTDIHHLRKNRACINVEHLCAKGHGFHSQDHKSGVARLDMRGSKHPMSKLTELQARAILADTEHTHRCLANKYGVSQPAISDIKSGKNWGFLSGGK